MRSSSAVTISTGETRRRATWSARMLMGRKQRSESTESLLLGPKASAAFSVSALPRPRCGGPNGYGRARGQAGDVVVHEKGVDERDRHRAQQGGGHERPPEEHVGPDEIAYRPDRDGLQWPGRSEDQGVEELVPGEREGEDGRGQDPRQRQGEHDPEQRAQPAA